MRNQSLRHKLFKPVQFNSQIQDMFVRKNNTWVSACPVVQTEHDVAFRVARGRENDVFRRKARCFIAQAVSLAEFPFFFSEGRGQPDP